MKNSLIGSILIFWVTNVFAQTDFRNVKWGMTIEDVKKSESVPLTGEEKSFAGFKDGKEYYDGIELSYEGSTVAERNANVYYRFKNGKLIKIRVIFTRQLYDNYDEKLSKVISSFTQLYEGLNKRGFKFTEPLQCGEHPYQGPDYKNPDNEKIRMMTNWGITTESLQLVEKMISDKDYKSVFFRAENQRSRAIVSFETIHSEFRKKTPIILEFTPSSKIEKEILASDF